MEIYNILLEKGASPNIKDPNGYSVLHVAAEKGDLDIVKDLVQRGADIELEVEGKSPLYLAFEHSKWEVVSFLKEKTNNFSEIEEKLKAQQLKDKVEPNKEKAEQIKILGNKFYTDKKYD